jgi:hypothetical protein
MLPKRIAIPIKSPIFPLLTGRDGYILHRRTNVLLRQVTGIDGLPEVEAKGSPSARLVV